MKTIGFIAALACLAASCGHRDQSRASLDASTRATDSATDTTGPSDAGATDVIEIDADMPTSPDPEEARFSVGGTIVGLLGEGLVVRNGLGPSLRISAGAKEFSMPTLLRSGDPYIVTVDAQPENPSQTCTVSNGEGIIATGAINNVKIACTTNAFAIGGTVSGLEGAGLVLMNGLDTVDVDPKSGVFNFGKSVESGGSYEVTVAHQPSAPAQTCTVVNGSGRVSSAAVHAIAVTCMTRTFAVGGTISGLRGSGFVLIDNHGALLPIAPGATTFSFATPRPSGSSYGVSVFASPAGPAQSCVISNGSGMVDAAVVGTIAISCENNSFTVGGSILGLTGSGLILGLGESSRLQVSAASAAFAFAAPVQSGAAIDVRVIQQPSQPTQTCVVSGGTGVMGDAAVNSVVVNCDENSYTLGGHVTGLSGPLVVAVGTATQRLTANGAFAFSMPFESGTTYEVSIASQPTSPMQTCRIANGTGTIASSDVSNVEIICVTREYRVEAKVVGLAGRGLALANNGDDALSVEADGTFAFSQTVASGGVYAVSVVASPGTPRQLCSLMGDASGLVTNHDVTVNVVCEIQAFPVTVSVSGLAGVGLVLQDNSGDDLRIPENGVFTFSQKVASGQTFEIGVSKQPTAPWQTCTVDAGKGTIQGSEPPPVRVSCVTNAFAIQVNVKGMVGGGLILQNEGLDDLEIVANGAFEFSSLRPSGATYDVSVAIPPVFPAQRCDVTAPSGVVRGGNVRVEIECAVLEFRVGGAVIGLKGEGLVLKNNGGDDLVVPSGATSFQFSHTVASGSDFSVTVAHSPKGQSCLLTGDVGLVLDSDVQEVAIVCFDSVCATATTDKVLNLTCGPGQAILDIVFASYGTPEGECGSFQIGACDASDTLDLVYRRCIGLESCSVTVNAANLGDPCVGAAKRLAVEVICLSYDDTTTTQAAALTATRGSDVNAASLSYGRPSRHAEMVSLPR